MIHIGSTYILQFFTMFLLVKKLQLLFNLLPVRKIYYNVSALFGAFRKRTSLFIYERRRWQPAWRRVKNSHREKLKNIFDFMFHTRRFWPNIEIFDASQKIWRFFFEDSLSLALLSNPYRSLVLSALLLIWEGEGRDFGNATVCRGLRFGQIGFWEEVRKTQRARIFETFVVFFVNH